LFHDKIIELSKSAWRGNSERFSWSVLKSVTFAARVPPGVIAVALRSTLSSSPDEDTVEMAALEVVELSSMKVEAVVCWEVEVAVCRLVFSAR
jgi:hypothetical protein